MDNEIITSQNTLNMVFPVSKQYNLKFSDTEINCSREACDKRLYSDPEVF